VLKIAVILLQLIMAYLKARERRLQEDVAASKALGDVTRELDQIRQRAINARLATSERLRANPTDPKDPFRLD